MIVTIHQPNFLPWHGFFDKVRQSDVFVLLDTVPFTKGGYQNRTQIKGAAGVQWLTVPIQTKGKLNQSTINVEFVTDASWKKKHFNAFSTLYGRTPFFREIMPIVEEIYARPSVKLVDLTIPLIKWICKYIGIQTTIIRSSEISVIGSGSQLLLNIVQCLGGTTYLSGPSGRNYLDVTLFESSNINVVFHEFQPFEYPQQHGDFVQGLSMIDYLFNVGNKHWW